MFSFFARHRVQPSPMDPARQDGEKRADGFISGNRIATIPRLKHCSAEWFLTLALFGRDDDRRRMDSKKTSLVYGRNAGFKGWFIGTCIRQKWLWDAFCIDHCRDLYLFQLGLLRHSLRHDDAFLKLHASLCRDNISMQSLRERYNLWQLVKQTRHVAGDLAEVGVAGGGTARLMCEVKGDKKLHLFDTFEGMPETDKSKDGIFTKGDFSTVRLDRTKNYLKAYSNVVFHPGFFPDTTSVLEPDTRFSFVHLDADIHRSTLDGLNYFYPRLNRGGVIVSHDYSHVTTPGVKMAFDEFFKDKPELVLPLWDTQCAVTKT